MDIHVGHLDRCQFAHLDRVVILLLFRWFNPSAQELHGDDPISKAFLILRGIFQLHDAPDAAAQQAVILFWVLV